MKKQSNYPALENSALMQPIELSGYCVAAVCDYGHSRPWRGSRLQQKKFSKHDFDLARVNRISLNLLRILRERSIPLATVASPGIMRNKRRYPNSVVDVLALPIEFPEGCITAVMAYAKSHPWRGTRSQQQQKVQKLYANLSRAHAIQAPRLIFSGKCDPDTSRSCCIPILGVVILRGQQISVVTALHEFGHHLGMDEHLACAYSIQLFQRCFPISFARCRFDRHMLRISHTP